MTEDEKRQWDAHAEREGVDLSAGFAGLVLESVDTLPPGRALDIATGEGRNAIFLAERGWEVDAVDISRTMLHRARERATARSVSVNWILADVDDYCFRPSTYDVITVSYFDARHRLSDLKTALAPEGVLCYEHHLLIDDSPDDPGARYRFESGELRAACADLAISRYEEDPAQRVVRLVAVHDVA